MLFGYWKAKYKDLPENEHCGDIKGTSERALGPTWTKINNWILLTGNHD